MSHSCLLQQYNIVGLWTIFLQPMSSCLLDDCLLNCSPICSVQQVVLALVKYFLLIPIVASILKYHAINLRLLLIFL